MADLRTHGNTDDTDGNRLPVKIGATLDPISATGSLTGAGQSVTLELLGRKSAAAYVTGTFTATWNMFVSRDGGTTWEGTFSTFNSGSGSYNGTAPVTFHDITAATHARIECLTYTSGTVNVSIYASDTPGEMSLMSEAYIGNNTPVTAILIGADNGGFLDNLSSSNNSLHTNLRNAAGTEIGTTTTPINAAIHDGTTKATVRELGTNDALNVAIVDGSGNQITTFGGGTQYTEDDTSAGNPTGNQLLARRRDSLSTETTTDGDVTALNATGKSELYVKHVDAIPVTDNGGTLTVDGTVTVQDGGSSISIDDNGSSLTIDNATLSVTGGGVESTALRVTIANDSTGVVSIDDNGSSLTVDNAGTFAVQVDGNALTALQLIDDTVVTLGTATYSEATTKGNVIGAVRRDADTTLVDTTNEIGPLQMDANGRLKVEVFDSGDSHTVDNAGTFAVQVDGNALTSLQLIDDIVYTDDTSTHSTGSSKGALIMAAATPTDGSVNANDIGAVAMTVDRKLHVSIQDALPAGTAAIGKLAANSGVDIGDVDVTSLPALASGTNLIGRTSSSDETSTVYNGTTALTPKFAAIDAATSGNNTLVAAVSSKKIRVLALFLVSAGTVNARFESGADGTALSGQMNLVANSGFVLPYNPVGWFETASNTLLNLELSAAISCDGSLTYVEV